MEINDVYWLVGLLEGEGFFSCVQRKNTPWVNPRIGFTSTDKDVTERVATLVGHKVYGPYKGKKKPVYNVRITGPRAVGWMMTLYPLLHSRRKEAIRKVIVAWKVVPPSKSAITYAWKYGQYKHS